MNKQEILKAIEQLKADILHHEAIIARNTQYPEYCKGEQLYIDALNIAISALEQQLNGGWIKTSKQPPKDYTEVWVTTEYGNVLHAFYANGDFRPGDYQEDKIYADIIAWKPIIKPEPYKENEDAERN